MSESPDTIQEKSLTPVEISSALFKPNTPEEQKQTARKQLLKKVDEIQPKITKKLSKAIDNEMSIQELRFLNQEITKIQNSNELSQEQRDLLKSADMIITNRTFEKAEKIISNKSSENPEAHKPNINSEYSLITKPRKSTDRSEISPDAEIPIEETNQAQSPQPSVQEAAL